LEIKLRQLTNRIIWGHGLAVSFPPPPEAIDGRPVTMNALPNNRFAAAGLYFRDRFQVFDAEGTIIGNHGEQISISDDFSPQHSGTAWYSQSVSHPDESASRRITCFH